MFDLPRSSICMRIFTVSKPRHKLVIVLCKVDLNKGLRRCPEKMSSLRGPTLKKIDNFLLFGMYEFKWY